MGALVTAVTVIPLLAALVGRCLRIPGRVWGPAAAVICLGASAAISVIVLQHHSAQWALRIGADIVVGQRADGLTAVMLPLIFGISLVVQVYARRYLLGDVRADHFFIGAAVLSAAGAALVSAMTLIGLAAAWTAAGIALCLLLRMYPDLDAARDGVARTRRAFLIGDGALWFVVAVITVRWGDWDLSEPAPWTTTPPGIEAAGLGILLVLAAASRSALIPFHRWLPATLAAPTPVSALLHAGVVNAGAILLLRTFPVVTAPPALHLAFALGAATAVYGTLLMVTKPDIKGALAHSTMAQMGFMVMTCGLGLFGPAIFHLVAHGMYKATLFLGSGAAVERHMRRDRTASPPALSPRTRAALIVAAGAAPAGVLAVAAPLLSPAGVASTEHKTALLVFVWATAAWAGWAWLRRSPSPRRVVTMTLALTAALPMYLGALSAVSAAVQPVVAVSGGVSAWLIVPVIAVMLLAAIVQRGWVPPWLTNLRAGLYVWALSRAHPGVRVPARRPAPSLPRPVVAPVPQEVAA